MSRTIVHIDMDAYFAAVEQQEVPALRGQPVVVCGDLWNRSVVTTASYEARALGVRAGMPVGRARRIASGAHFIEGDLPKYIAVSLELLRVFCRYAPLVEPYSIDEAFLDITGCPGEDDPARLVNDLKEAVRRETGLGCSAGAGPNKLLAKMACELRKPDGYTRINPVDVPTVIWPLPVERLYGVGEKTAAFLRQLGLGTVGDLARTPRELLEKMFGVNGGRLHQAAHGIDASPVSPGTAMVFKSCGHELTLPSDSSDEGLIRRYLLFLCENVSRRMRLNRYSGRTVTLKMRDPGFRTITRALTRREPTDQVPALYADAQHLLASHWDRGALRLLGVSVSGLSRTGGCRQLELFGDVAREGALTEVLDRIRDKYGDHAVTRASFLLRG